jgi:predicted DNA-binding transcriptional regulator YafY
MEVLLLVLIVLGLWAWLKDDSPNPRPPDRAEKGRTPEHSSAHGAGTGSARSATPHRTHGGKRQTPTTEETLLLAIKNGWRINISYVDQDGEFSYRAVTPLGLERRHDAEILCLIGHCHMRNAARTFVVRRIKSVDILR